MLFFFHTFHGEAVLSNVPIVPDHHGGAEDEAGMAKEVGREIRFT